MATHYVHHRGLWCCLGGISFPDDHTVALRLAPGHCTDMSGAIRYAKAVSRDLVGFELRRIVTIADREPDTVYTRTSDGDWTAREAKTVRP